MQSLKPFISTALSHSYAANLPTQLTSLPLRTVVGPDLLRPLRLQFFGLILILLPAHNVYLYLYFAFAN